MNNESETVAIIYHYIAHYRKPIFDTLCASETIDYYVVADVTSNIASLKVLNKSIGSSGPNISRKWLQVKNIWITKNILWQTGLVRLALNSHYDHLIFLGNMYFISTWVAVILARLNGKKVYFWTHGVRNSKTNLKEKIRFNFYRLADGVFLYGNTAKKILSDRGLSASKLHVIYNSLDFDEQTGYLLDISPDEKIKKRQDLGIKSNDKIIVTSGRLTQSKKIELLIQALSKINLSSIENHKLIIIGDGPDKASIETESTRLQVVDDVIFYGECYNEKDISLLISMSDVFVVPGDIGLSAIHSLTYGTPVVTHDHFITHKPEYEAIKDGVNGSFYKLNDVDDMVKKILFWSMKNNNDVFDQCRSVISKFYNADYQKRIIDQVIQDNS